MTFFPLSLTALAILAIAAQAILAIVALAGVAVALTRSNHRRPEMNDEEEDNETFLRRFCICEEERLARTGEMRTGLKYWPLCERDFPHREARGQALM